MRRAVKFLASASGITAVMAMTALLGSCRTQREITAEREAAVAIVDTTTVAVDIDCHASATTHMEMTGTTHEGRTTVEFVEGGGRVSVDSSGNVTLEGVRNLSGELRDTTSSLRGSSTNQESASMHATEDNGIDAKVTSSEKVEENTKPTHRWHETLFMRLGQGVCIAGLLYLFFLYLKRKR